MDQQPETGSKNVPEDCVTDELLSTDTPLESSKEELGNYHSESVHGKTVATASKENSPGNDSVHKNVSRASYSGESRRPSGSNIQIGKGLAAALAARRLRANARKVPMINTHI
jgi:hypothetical protein